MFHGHSGFATSHFKRWKSTPVQRDTSREDEAKERYKLNRVDHELCDRSGSSNSWTDYSLSPLFYPHFAVRHWLDCVDLYCRIGSAILSPSKIV
jgi:hypothetical protein